MNDLTHGNGIAPGDRDAVRYRKKEFWREEHRKFVHPHFRLEKAARIVNTIASGRQQCDLLDVGCGPATMMRLLNSNIRYHGLDISIEHPAPNLAEADFLETPICFGNKTFDIVVAQGVFEYVGTFQQAKFSDIASILGAGGTFIVSYTNFGHRRAQVDELYNNVQPLDQFRRCLTRHFTVERYFPVSHNWYHGQPSRRLIKAVQTHFNMNIPMLSPLLAVEYFFICSIREPATR